MIAAGYRPVKPVIAASYRPIKPLIASSYKPVRPVIAAGYRRLRAVIHCCGGPILFSFGLEARQDLGHQRQARPGAELPLDLHGHDPIAARGHLLVFSRKCGDIRSLATRC